MEKVRQFARNYSRGICSQETQIPIEWRRESAGRSNPGRIVAFCQNADPADSVLRCEGPVERSAGRPECFLDLGKIPEAHDPEKQSVEVGFQVGESRSLPSRLPVRTRASSFRCSVLRAGVRFPFRPGFLPARRRLVVPAVFFSCPLPRRLPDSPIWARILLTSVSLIVPSMPAAVHASFTTGTVGVIDQRFLDK